MEDVKERITRATDGLTIWWELKRIGYKQDTSEWKRLGHIICPSMDKRRRLMINSEVLKSNANPI